MDNEYLKGEFKTNIFRIETDDQSPFSSDSLILTTVERAKRRDGALLINTPPKR